MNRRGQLIIAAFVLAIAAYFVVVWRAQSTPHKTTNAGAAKTSPKPSADPTAKWATYTSADPKLSVKYPVGWIVIRQPLPAVISNKSDITTTAPDALYLLIDSRPGSSLDACYAVSSYNQGYSYTTKPASVGGRSGSRYTIDPRVGSGKSGYATAYLFVQNNRCYDVTLVSTSASARDQNATLTEEIAGTLKL